MPFDFCAGIIFLMATNSVMSSTITVKVFAVLARLSLGKLLKQNSKVSSAPLPGGILNI